MAECSHAWVVWDDGAKPVAELPEGATEQEAWNLINHDKETRYAECSECGATLNA